MQYTLGRCKQKSCHLSLSLSAQTLQDPDAARYVSGVAVHWYADTQVGPKVLDEIHDSFPDKFLLYSEACTGK